MPDINTLTGIGYPKRKIGCVLGVKVRIQADILENQLQSNCTMKSKVRPKPANQLFPEWQLKVQQKSLIQVLYSNRAF
jgi:hypothetical protein